MAEFTLSAATQSAIKNAVTNGSRPSKKNYIAPYDFNADFSAHSGATKQSWPVRRSDARCVP